MSDFKIFLKYVFNLRGFSKGLKKEIKKLFEPQVLSIVFFGIAIYIFLKVPHPNGVRLAVGIAVLAIIANLRAVYIDGEHRHWWRQKIGIKSKKELIRIEHEKPILIVSPEQKLTKEDIEKIHKDETNL